jgi:cation diffusion facilitator CzcD-associated flavoprotein CzcO
MIAETEGAMRTDGKTGFDAIVVGAGFAGLVMLYRLRELGFSVRVFEAGSGIGGTWFWNRYPGARCDIESLEYSYQFSPELQQEWEWSERYATQPEILRYLEHVADRFDLRRDIQLDTRVRAAHWSETARHWTVETEGGIHTARFFIMATGCLSSANLPDFPGRDSFAGPTYHTGRWPHDGVDFTGQRVAVIGTGSSAIQSIPLIAEQAAQLTVFQRTPSYSIPAHNAPLDPELVRKVKANYASFRAHNAAQPFGASFEPSPLLAVQVDAAERDRIYERHWQVGGLGFITAFGDLLFDHAANETAGEFVRRKISAIVRDPVVADKLLPKQVIGCKRLCVDTGYYATFNRPNVSLVDVSETPIEAITPRGVRVAGVEHEVDAIVFATGFDAMTGALLAVDIRGADGQTLREKWVAGPRTYLGVGTAGFPNLFIITGPGSPSVLSNMVPSIEQHAEWIAACLAYLREHGLSRIDALPAAEDAWGGHVNDVANLTVYPSCNSWYLGANVPGKPRVFMPYIGFPTYVAKCNEVAAKGYEGFDLSA